MDGVRRHQERRPDEGAGNRYRLTSASPSTSWTSSSSSGTTIVGGSPSSSREVGDALLVALGQRRDLARRGADARGELVAELLGQLGEVAVDRRRLVHPVDQHAAERHPRGATACGGSRSPPRPARAAGEVTIRNVVAGSDSSASTRRARSVKPSIMPPSARKNTERSCSRSTPVTRLRIENTMPVPRPISPPGAQEHADRAALEEVRQPARRVEEVERVARRRRVEHEQVPVALLVELVELGDRRELLRAGDRGRELLVDAVGRAPRRASPRRAPGAR